MKENILLFMADMGIEDFTDMANLYDDYISECNGLVEQIAEILPLQSQAQWKELERVMHNIKGVSANLYVKEVSHKATLLDDYLRQNVHCLTSTHQFLLKWQELLRSFEQAKIEIVQFFTQRM